MIENTTAPIETRTSRSSGAGLAALREVNLGAEFETMLEQARVTAGGSALWRARKIAELRDIFALATISDRIVIEWFDVCTDLRMLLALRAPVPLRGPEPGALLVIGPDARLGLTYRPEVLSAPQPGYSFVQILTPGGVHHPNVSADDYQAVCLGQLPIGIPLKEILLLTYGALSMQTVNFSLDAAGVLNPAAAAWWQQNTHRIPLSREPFLFRPITTP
jgi:hypothetical protein